MVLEIDVGEPGRFTVKRLVVFLELDSRTMIVTGMSPALGGSNEQAYVSDSHPIPLSRKVRVVSLPKSRISLQRTPPTPC